MAQSVHAPHELVSRVQEVLQSIQNVSALTSVAIAPGLHGRCLARARMRGPCNPACRGRATACGSTTTHVAPAQSAHAHGLHVQAGTPDRRQLDAVLLQAGFLSTQTRQYLLQVGVEP